MGNYVKTPTIFQMEATECGAASLSMIFAYFGKNLSLEQMRIETGVSRDGCNAGNIMRAAKKFGFECHGYRKEPEALKKTIYRLREIVNEYQIETIVLGYPRNMNDTEGVRTQKTEAFRKRLLRDIFTVRKLAHIVIEYHLAAFEYVGFEILIAA